jgi:DNA-binding response OmpR family regulator
MTDFTRSPTASDAQTDAHTAGGDPTEDDGSVVLLHVEPDARSAELLAAFAERFADGFVVLSVDGMGAALDAVGAVDCVVTEQRLPDGSGVELVERLRERGSDVPVAFHTTCRERETESRALDAGADAYFSKRPERGQYDRILERLRGLVGDDAGNVRPATTVAPSAAESSASEE